jgi:hypothetical protein
MISEQLDLIPESVFCNDLVSGISIMIAPPSFVHYAHKWQYLLRPLPCSHKISSCVLSRLSKYHFMHFHGMKPWTQATDYFVVHSSSLNPMRYERVLQAHKLISLDLRKFCIIPFPIVKHWNQCAWTRFSHSCPVAWIRWCPLKEQNTTWFIK